MSSGAHPVPARGASKSSWLCRAEFDRERMLDMEARVRSARRRTFVIVAVAVAALGPWLGWIALLFLIPVSLMWSAAERFMPRPNCRSAHSTIRSRGWRKVHRHSRPAKFRSPSLARIFRACR